MQKNEIGLGGTVVLKMTENIHGKGHKVTFDNYFSSVPLLEKLKANKINACGTIRTRRKYFPILASDKSLKRGDFDYRSTNNGITVFKWMDSKAVHFISNYHGLDLTTVQRKEKDGTKTTLTCPKVVADYNATMGGVDKHDMLRHLYGVNRKSVKWWHRIFFGLLDMAIVNAYVLYNSSPEIEKNISLLAFRQELALGLLTFAKQKRTPIKRRRRHYSVPSSVRFANVGIHFPKFIRGQGRRCEVIIMCGSLPG